MLSPKEVAARREKLVSGFTQEIEDFIDAQLVSRNKGEYESYGIPLKEIPFKQDISESHKLTLLGLIVKKYSSGGWKVDMTGGDEQLPEFIHFTEQKTSKKFSELLENLTKELKELNITKG